MRDLPPAGVARCQCVEVLIGNDITARLLLYTEQGECVGESRTRGFSDATLDLVARLKDSIERDFAEHLGGSGLMPEEAVPGDPFRFDLPPSESGGRDFGPDS
jgi:hypothetical protein